MQRFEGELRRRLLVASALAWTLNAGADEAPAAACADGRYRAAGVGVAPDAALQLWRDGEALRRYPVRSLDGREAGRVRWLWCDAERRSFGVGFEGLNELWELSLDPAAPPIFNGYVHDYAMGEAIAEPGFLGLRRTRLPEALQAVLPAPFGYVLGQAAAAAPAGSVLHLLQLDVRRSVARFELNGPLDLARSRTLWREGRAQVALAAADGTAGWTLDLRAARLLPP